MPDFEIKVDEIDGWASLITGLVVTGLQLAAADAKARGKEKITLEELSDLVIKPNEDLLERLRKKAAGETPGS